MTEILINNTLLTVDYSVTPYRAQSQWEPEEPSELEILSVKAENTDITKLLADAVLKQIEVKLIDQFFDDIDENPSPLEARRLRNLYRLKYPL